MWDLISLWSLWPMKRRSIVPCYLCHISMEYLRKNWQHIFTDHFLLVHCSQLSRSPHQSDSIYWIPCEPHPDGKGAGIVCHMTKVLEMEDDGAGVWTRSGVFNGSRASALWPISQRPNEKVKGEVGRAESLLSCSRALFQNLEPPQLLERETGRLLPCPFCQA